MKVSFLHPISDSKEWEGQLHVEGEVKHGEPTITKVIMEDADGQRADVTTLIDNWCSSLYDSLCDAARNNAINDEDFSGCRTRQYA